MARSTESINTKEVYYNGTANEVHINIDELKADIKIFKDGSSDPAVHFHHDTGKFHANNLSSSEVSATTIYYDNLIRRGTS